MRRPMFLLSLIAALAGTPLRLAEAAHDIACALAESGGDGVIEIPDGGVGDDSDATIKAETTHVPVTSAVVAAVPGLVLLVPPPWQVLWRRADRPLRAGAGHQRRLALLQCFLC